MEAAGPAATAKLGRRAAYGDAVGDLKLMTEKWGPSLSLFQIRALAHPEQYGFPDTLRVAADIRFPEQNAQAAFHISKSGTNFSPWSAFKSGLHLPHKGLDYEIITGYPGADNWDAVYVPPVPPPPAEPVFFGATPLAQVSLDGFLVNNNVWNAKEAGTQEIFVFSPHRWRVRANHSRTDVQPGSIKSYPDTQKNFTNRSIDSFSEIKSTFSMTNPPVGEWNACYDIWIGGIGGKCTAEVMIWTDHRYNGVIPPKNAVDSAGVVIDGQGFNAWRRPLNAGDTRSYIALAMNPMKATGSIDLLAVFRELMALGWLKGTDLVAAIEYGVEIANTITPAGGPQTFRLNDFQLEYK